MNLIKYILFAFVFMLQTDIIQARTYYLPDYERDEMHIAQKRVSPTNPSTPPTAQPKLVLTLVR